MAGGQWEVVGKAKKIKSKPSKVPVKEKGIESNGYEIKAPIVESQTLFSAFLEKENMESPEQKLTPSENHKASASDKNQPKKKKTDKKPDKSLHKPKRSLEDAFSLITEEDLKNHLAKLEVLYPDSPLLWLKDLASYFNVKLDVAIEDLSFSNKPAGYPSSLLDKKIYKIVLKTLKRCSPPVLQVFYEHCLMNMVQDTLKGLHTVGYRIMLQMSSVEMSISNLSKCLDLCNTYQNRPNICLLILWAASQVGLKNLEGGFRVWLDLMFPLIGLKHCMTYIVDSLERLIGNEEVLSLKKSILTASDLFSVLDFIHSNNLGRSMQKRLLLAYPTLKRLAYGPEPESILRHYFPSYLHRLDPQSSDLLKNEILNSLLYCLEKDKCCYSLWRQLYSKQFLQSKLVISHLNDNWKNVNPKFPKRCLRDTLCVFQVTNEELLNGGKKSLHDIEECITINKELLFKMRDTFSWPRLVLTLVLIVSSFLTYDILAHGPDSSTGKFLTDSGILIICGQIGEKFVYFSRRVQKLTEQYFPVFASWFETQVLPLLDFLAQNLKSNVVLLWNSTSELRVWFSRTMPPLMETVEKHFLVYGTEVWSTGRNAAITFSQYTLIGMKYILDSAESFAVWLESNPQIMNALKATKEFTNALVENVQQNVVHLFQQAKSYLPIQS